MNSADPKEMAYNGVLVGVPTFGLVNINWAMNQATTGIPIFTTRSYLSVIGKPVDVARNEIAASAILKGYGFVWFRDDDVISPPDSLVKLMGRMSPKQRAEPRQAAECIIGGVVYSKIRPPQPLIFRRKSVGGFEDWNFGDLVEADSIGMGCTLIPVGAFMALKDIVEEYQCVNDLCSVKWNEVYGKDQLSCPHCGSRLVPIFFKTVRGGKVEDKSSMIFLTEDTYFCKLLTKAGVKIYADCGVQCRHECNETGTAFYYHEEWHIPVWECDGDIQFYPTTSNPLIGKQEFKPKRNGHKNGKVKFNVGCGGDIKKDFVNIDAFSEIDCDFHCDITDLKPVVRKYGQADEIIARHVLEHVKRTKVVETVKNWMKALKPGGVLKIIVPDARWTMEFFLEKDIKGSVGDRAFAEGMVFGEQRYPYDEHRAGITENRMKNILASCEHQLARSSIKSFQPKGAWSKEIHVRAVKKKAKEVEPASKSS